MPRWTCGSVRRAGCFLLAGLLVLWSRPVSGKPFLRDWWLAETNTPIRVNDLLQDTSGYLWLATAQGLFRFNGSTFFQLPATRGEEVTALVRWRSGLLAGFRSGKTAFVSGDQIIPFTYKGQQATTAITSFLHGGAFCAFGTLGGGLWWVSQDSAHVLSTATLLRDDYVYAIERLPAQRGLLVATDRGIDWLHSISGKPGITSLIPEGIMQVLRPVPGRPGSYIAGSQEGNWYELTFPPKGGAPTVLKHPASAAVTDVAFLEGQLLVFTEDGTAKCFKQPTNPATPYILTDSFELGPRSLRKTWTDAHGNLWLATAAGLSQCTYAYLRQAALSENFSLSAVTALAYGDGCIWYTQENRLLAYSLRTHQLQVNGRLPVAVTSLSAAKTGLWIGTLGGGVLFRPWGANKAARMVPGMKAFGQEHVLDVTAQANRLWMATLNGVEELEILSDSVKTIRHHSKKNGLGTDYVYQILTDTSGTVWMATDGGGVCIYQNGRYRRAGNGQAGWEKTTVYSLAQGQNHLLWAATLEKGLSVFDGRQWSDIASRYQLQTPHTSAVAALGNGNIVVAHERGADVWLDHLKQFRHINRRLGVGIDSTAPGLNCITTDSFGNVWLPFEDGLLQIRAFRPGKTSRPGLAFLGITTFDSPQKSYKKDFAPGENSLTFHYEGINLLNPEKLSYRYRLEGFSREWAYTRDEAVPFSRLPPGHYRFVIEASYSASFEGASRQEYPFRVAAPWWQRGWVVGMFAAGAAALLIGAVRIRERNIRKLATLQKAQLEAEYQQLKTQVNPHFLFNSLNILTTLIGRNPQQAVEYTLALSDLYRSILQYSHKDRISLGEEWKLLQQYFLVQQTRFGKALCLHSAIPQLFLDTASIVPLTLQMLVENAIKHNIVSAARPLVIDIHIAGTMLVVCNPYQPRPRPEKGTGMGLANIESRYRILGHSISYGIVADSFVVKIPLL